MDSKMKRDIILDNYQNPQNKGIPESDKYKVVNSKNDSCVDNIDVAALIKDGVVDDIKFDGEACAICTSSTSIMIDTLIGKKVSDALNIIDNYEKMINEENYDEQVLEQAIVYDDISKQPNRKNCALLTWRGAKEILDKSKK